VLNELTPDSGLTDTYSTLADSRSCGRHYRSFGHALTYPTVDSMVDIGSTSPSVK